MMENAYHQELCNLAQAYFEEYLGKIEAAFERLTEEQVWLCPNEASNSMGNQVLHLCGNIRQYAISSLGRQEDVRERDSEFEAKAGLNKSELMEKLRNTVKEAIAVFEKLDEEELLRKRHVQAYHYSGLAVLIHVVEHFAYHTGQIIFWAKQLSGKGFDFYANVDLNEKGNLS